MNTRFVSFAVSICFVLSLGVATRAQSGHSVRGKVRNERGSPVAGISLDLHTGTGSLIAQTVTNNEGDFFFGGLEGSSYVLVIASPDYTPINERIDFVKRVSASEPGETRTVELTLMRKTAPRTSAPGTTFVQDVPATAYAALTRALKLSKDGKGALALALLQEAIRIFPNYFDARFALGNELMKGGRLDEAIAELEQARRINPKDSRVYETFGLVLMRQKKYGVAAAVFAEASRLNPLNPQPQLLRAMALIEFASVLNAASGKTTDDERAIALSEAEQNLTRAFELSGQKMTGVYLQRARIYEKRGELARAAAELELYLRESPDTKNTDALRQAIKKLRDAASLQKASSQP